RARDPAFRGFIAVDVEGNESTLPEATAVVGEFHPYLVLSGRQRGAGGHPGALQTEKIVMIFELPFVNVETPSAHVAAMRGNDAFGAGRRNFQVGRDRMRLVLDIDRRVLGQP